MKRKASAPTAATSALTIHGGEVNSGRGDSHHSLYAGLNWYLCGDNAKFMTGVEYQQLDTAAGDASATSLLLAYRMYF